MENFLRLFVFIIFCVGTLQLQAQYKTNLTSGNFSFTTSSGSSYISFTKGPNNNGFRILQKPGSEESPSTIYHSCLTFGGYIDGLLYVYMNRYVPDFRLGPILANGNYHEEYESAYDTIWVVHRQEIQSFLQDFNDGQIDDAHPAIFGWPAKGNQILLNDSIPLPDQDLAPFYDKNNNGKYEPMLGEYPSQDGDLSGKSIPTYISWSVYNTDPVNQVYLGNIEVQTIAYAYACENSTSLNNTAFFKMKVINRNPQPIHLFKIPISFDGDLGCETNDYWGTDLPSESLYFYSDTTVENFCASGSIPLPEGLQVAQSLSLLDRNLDASNDYAVNNQLAELPPQIGEYEFYNVVSGKTPYGKPIPFGWGSPLENPSDTVTQLFTDRPSNSDGWNMRNSTLGNYDYRPFASIFVPEFASNEELEINFATVTSFDTSGQYDNFTIVDKLLDEDIPEAINAYRNEFANIECDYQELCDRLECVWPGDSNNDERVFIDDFIQTGWLIKEQKKGNNRNYPTADWLPFHCESWGETYNDIEIKHADASGDGQIQVNDLQIIEDNFQKQTPLYQAKPWQGPQTSKVPLKIKDAEIRDYQGPSILKYIPMQITIGSKLFPVEDLHSICFTIEFEDDYIDLEKPRGNFLDSTYSDYDVNPWLLKLSSDQVHVAITELNDTSYSGGFTVAKFGLRIVSGLTTSNPYGNIVSQMSLKNVRALRNDGTEIPLKVENGTLTIKNVEISTTASPEATKSDIRIYPNPSTDDELYISGIENERITASFYNANGSLVSTKKITGNSIDVSGLQAGFYFIQFRSDNVRYEIKRFVKLD